jgi:predicted enzyme related to lactoylglutathione lyase
VGNPVVWFEIYTPDIERAKEFYGLMFGWQFSPVDRDDTGYCLISTQEGSASGGIVQSDDPPGEQGVLLYVQVERLEGAIEGAKVLGAVVEQSPTLISDEAGSYAVLLDPTGCRVGLWSPEVVVTGNEDPV